MTVTFPTDEVTLEDGTVTDQQVGPAWLILQIEAASGLSLTNGLSVSLMTSDSATFTLAPGQTVGTEDAVITLRSRSDTAPMFVESTSFPIYQQALFLHLDPPFIIAEKTDFDFLASTVTNNTEVVLNLGFSLVDNRA